MKRLPTTHKKTPMSKEEKAPDFYELSKISPLPEVTFSKPTASYNGPLHPTSGAASMDASQGDDVDSKDKNRDEALENMRLSNELLRRQLHELQQRNQQNPISGLPTVAEAEMRMNQQLMQLQKEKFEQVQKDQHDNSDAKDEDKVGV